MQNKSYTAITIGPIGDTMNLITKPAALWAASYMFSFISKSICEEAAEIVGAKNIISPFFPDKNDENERDLYNLICARNDGIGLFHDRIIIIDNGKFMNAFDDVKAKVLAKVSDTFDVWLDYLSSYIMINACNFSLGESCKSNAIMHSSKMLDCLELSKSFVSAETYNPLHSSLSNDNVKKIGINKLNICDDLWQLLKNKSSVRDIPDICHTADARGFKKNNYYCILRSDGDNMGQLISLIKNDDDCREFSKVCLQHCNDIATIVGEYGGLTVYAGGDDLFAIVPMESALNSERKNIFNLIQSINVAFDARFSKYNAIIEENNSVNTEKIPLPSLSFGAFICHEKYPLYEAIANADSLLFGVAKNTKNCVAIHLQKHSGQSQEMVITNSAVNQTAEMISALIESDSDQFMLSAAYKIITFEKLINASHGDDMIKNVFKNIFDADFHIEYSREFLHEKLPEIYSNYCKNDLITLYENHEKTESGAKTLGQFLRLLKFFVEKD